MANPAEARDPKIPPAAPQQSETHAISTKINPCRTMPPISAPALISLIRFAVINGISTSMNTSPTIASRVSKEAFLYSLIHFLNNLSTAYSFLRVAHTPSLDSACSWRINSALFSSIRSVIVKNASICCCDNPRHSAEKTSASAI